MYVFVKTFHLLSLKRILVTFPCHPRCLRAATKLAQENLMGADEYCAKFHDRILPEAFRKLLASHATQRWGQEIQEGIYDMLELFIDLGRYSVMA